MRLANLSQGNRKWKEAYTRGKLEIIQSRAPNFYRFSGSCTYRQTERTNGTEFKSTDKYNAEFIYRRSFFENWFTQMRSDIVLTELKGLIVKFKSVRALVMNIGLQIVLNSSLVEAGNVRSLRPTLKMRGLASIH